MRYVFTLLILQSFLSYSQIPTEYLGVWQFETDNGLDSDILEVTNTPASSVDFKLLTDYEGRIPAHNISTRYKSSSAKAVVFDLNIKNVTSIGVLFRSLDKCAIKMNGQIYYLKPFNSKAYEQKVYAYKMKLKREAELRELRRLANKNLRINNTNVKSYVAFSGLWQTDTIAYPKQLLVSIKNKKIRAEDINYRINQYHISESVGDTLVGYFSAAKQIENGLKFKMYLTKNNLVIDFNSYKVKYYRATYDISKKEEDYSFYFKQNPRGNFSFYNSYEQEVPGSYSSIELLDQYYVCKNTSGIKVLDENLNPVFEKLSEFTRFKTSKNYLLKTQQKYYIYDVNLKEMAGPFSAKPIDYSDNIALVKKGSLYYYIKKNNTTINSSGYQLAKPFHNGIAIVGKRKPTGTLYGAIAADGSQIISYKFLKISSFYNGKAFALTTSSSPVTINSNGGVTGNLSHKINFSKKEYFNHGFAPYSEYGYACGSESLGLMASRSNSMVDAKNWQVASSFNAFHYLAVKKCKEKTYIVNNTGSITSKGYDEITLIDNGYWLVDNFPAGVGVLTPNGSELTFYDEYNSIIELSSNFYFLTCDRTNALLYIEGNSTYFVELPYNITKDMVAGKHTVKLFDNLFLNVKNKQHLK